MWTRTDYENAADQIGKDFVVGNGDTSINNLSLKVAQEQGLNPNGIRTLVRLANVAAWEQNFEKRSNEKAADRVVEFEVGDPEVVISQLHNEVKEAQLQEKTASEYDRTQDYYGDVEYEQAPLEKTASAVPGVELTPSQAYLPSAPEMVLILKKAEDKMREEHGAAQTSWITSLEKAAALLVAADSRVTTRDAFEKNAASLLGESIIPELNMMHKLTSPKNADIVLFGGEKTATVLNTHIASVLTSQQPIIELLKIANESRKLSHLKKAGLEWLEENRARVTK